MKKFAFITLFLCASILLNAQSLFEGKMVFKVLNSYSESYSAMAPQYYSGADVVEVYIKGNTIHEHYKESGLHRIYNGDKMYYYSENTKTGFSLPIHFQSYGGVKEVLDTEESRPLLGNTCSVYKILYLMNASTTEIDCWIADNTYNISQEALRTLYTDFCSRVETDFDGKLCLKLSSRVYLTGNNDKIIKLAKSVTNKEQRKVFFGSATKEVTEMSMSQIFEVTAISAEAVAEALMLPPSDIQIDDISLEGATTAPMLDKDTYIAGLMADHYMRKLIEKGKVDVDKLYEDACAQLKSSQQQLYEDPNSFVAGVELLGKDFANSVQKNIDDMHASGATQEDATYNSVFSVHEKKLILANKEYLKAHNVNVEKEIQPVVYNIDEEWDF